MKIIGILKAFNESLFCVSTSNSVSRIDIYSAFDLQNPENTIELSPDRLNTITVKEYNNYLICSAIISKTGKVTKAYGNVGVLTTVLSNLAEMGAMVDVVSGLLGPGIHTYGNRSVEIITVNNFIASASVIAGLKYTPITQPIPTRQFNVGVTRGKLKTFSEVIAEHDMSWYYDGNGKCKKDYRLIQSIDQLREILADADKYEYLSFDTETDGTNFYWYKGDSSKRSRICGMSLSWRVDQGIYIPFISKMFDELDLHEVMQILYPLMRRKKVICHNGIFDFKVMYSYGYYIPIAHDTLLMEFNIDPNVKKGSKGLKTLTRKYLNHETIELEELTGGRVIAELIPYIDSELIKVYACSDSDYTLQLFNLLYPYVEKMQSYALDCRLIDILAIAEYQGAPINTELLNTMSTINHRNMQTVEHYMRAYIQTVGTQKLAVKAIKGVRGDDYIPTTEEVLQLCHYPAFLESIKPAFSKQNKKKEGEELQFSSSADIGYILYDLLEYPVLKVNDSGARSSDKEAISKLLEFSSTEPNVFLSEDILTCAPEFGVKSSEVIISKKKFESYLYPFAYMLSIWRKLQKFDSSFFGPLLEENSDGYYYTDNSMTSAETARVINKIQTLEGSLKELVVPRGNDWYMIVFDKSQIEYRVMLGLAANYWNALVKSDMFQGNMRNLAQSKDLTALIENLNNWEKDYHREGGAIFAGCTPDTMTKKQRKSVKAIHFSVPYGAEAASVAKPKLAGHPESEHADIIAETEAELSAWRNKLYPLYYFLEHVRDKALVPIDKNPPGHYGVYGKVTNALGRYRLFDLSDSSFASKSSIRRAAGNYPIQSLARDIFFSGINKLFRRLMQEGLITESFDTSKVVLSLFVHDEVVIQVHKSIHPYRMYKYIMETNLTKLKGHPTYFMGIAVADTWGKGKTDSYEAPIAYVEDCIKEYEANQELYDSVGSHEYLPLVDYTKLCWDGITNWFAKRVCREIEEVQQGSSVIDPVYIGDKLINYYVKSRLPYYSQKCRKEEYSFDASLPTGSEDMNYNSYIQLFDYYLLITGEYKKYSLKFNGKIIPYAEVLDFKVIEDNLDMDYLEDLELSEMDEDYKEKEEQYAEEYYIIQDALAISLNEKSNTEEDTDHTQESKVPVLWTETGSGDIVFFISGMSPAQFNRLTGFLTKYISKTGKPLKFFNGHTIDSKVKIDIQFSNEEVYHAVFDTTEKTDYFGG